MVKIIIDGATLGEREARCISQNVRDQQIDANRLSLERAVFDTTGTNLEPDGDNCITLTLKLRLV